MGWEQLALWCTQVATLHSAKAAAQQQWYSSETEIEIAMALVSGVARTLTALVYRVLVGFVLAHG